jgi:hypothetical protein
LKGGGDVNPYEAPEIQEQLRQSDMVQYKEWSKTMKIGEMLQ